MKRYPLVLLFLLTAGAPAALGQQPSDGLTDQQRLGRQFLSQSCGVCHLPPARGARTYGPQLHKGTSGGDDALMRKFITVLAWVVVMARNESSEGVASTHSADARSAGEGYSGTAHSRRALASVSCPQTPFAVYSIPFAGR